MKPHNFLLAAYHHIKGQDVTEECVTWKSIGWLEAGGRGIHRMVSYSIRRLGEEYVWYFGISVKKLGI